MYTTLKALEKLPVILARLLAHFGEPALPPANGPFELVMWENACYLLSDARRAEVFEALRSRVGLTPAAILNADRSLLLEIAQRGGMRPEVRVLRWRQIATIAQQNPLQDPDPAQARKALLQYPNIGEPAADKILLFCGLAQGLPLESNGLRVLSRLGFGREQKSYGATYRSAQEAIRPQLPESAGDLARAHLLLRQHGKTYCKTTSPACGPCPINDACSFNARC